MERADKQTALIGNNLAVMPLRDVVLAMNRRAVLPWPKNTFCSALHEGGGRDQPSQISRCCDLNHPSNLSVRLILFPSLS